MFGSVRQIKLPTRQLLGGRKYSLSYRIVSNSDNTMTLSYRQGHSPIASLFKWDFFGTVVQQLTKFQVT